MRDAKLSAERITEIFENGRIEVQSETDSDQLLVKVEYDGDTINAAFIPDPRGRNFVPDLAAYQLDRWLSLGMVPVTVKREFDGDDGVLQFLPGATINEAQRSAAQSGAGAHCPLADQWNAMYIFDSLIHNPGRVQQQMLYSQDNWQLMLTGHGRSFENRRTRPPYLKDVPLNIGSVWQERLEALNDDVIAEQFAETLERRRQRALGQRRDGLLEDAAEPSPVTAE